MHEFEGLSINNIGYFSLKDKNRWKVRPYIDVNHKVYLYRAIDSTLFLRRRDFEGYVSFVLHSILLHHINKTRC